MPGSATTLRKAPAGTPQLGLLQGAPLPPLPGSAPYRVMVSTWEWVLSGPRPVVPIGVSRVPAIRLPPFSMMIELARKSIRWSLKLSVPPQGDGRLVTGGQFAGVLLKILTLPNL